MRLNNNEEINFLFQKKTLIFFFESIFPFLVTVRIKSRNAFDRQPDSNQVFNVGNVGVVGVVGEVGDVGDDGDVGVVVVVGVVGEHFFGIKPLSFTPSQITEGGLNVEDCDAYCSDP